jgi:hypothetical protein
MNRPSISPRARIRHDRAGDPLDGLVNLFDLGIVLAVAFLLAALSSVKLSATVLGKNGQKAAAPAGSVVKGPNEQSNTVKIPPGGTVIGRGRAIGTVYQLEDGSTVLVRPKSAGGTITTPAPSTTTGTPPATSTTP